MEKYVEEIVNTLMREYELHKQEVLLQIQLYNRQTNYILLYAGFLLSLVSFLVKEGKLQSQPIGDFIIFVFLLLPAFIALYLISNIMSSVYMFLIIRRRMSKIENNVNSFLREPKLLSYETQVTRHFLEKHKYGPGIAAFTPHALSTLWRIGAFLVVIAILCWVAYTVLENCLWKVSYIVIVGSLSFIQVFVYIWMNTSGKKHIEDFITEKDCELYGSKKGYAALMRPSNFSYIVVSILALLAIIFSMDFLRNIYLMFVSNGFFQVNHWLIAFYIFVYEIACAMFWPTPSEAPLLLYAQIPLFLIIIVSAIGKGIGAYLVCKWWNIIDEIFKKLHKILEELHEILKKLHLVGILRIKTRVEHWIKKRGFPAYLVTQAIPLVPMRTGIYVYSYVSRDAMKVAIGAALGAVIRNLSVLFLYWMGLTSIKAITS
jgi:hypothetical protein